MTQMQASNRGTIAVYVIIIVGIVISGILLYLSRPEPVQLTIIPPDPTQTPLPTSTPAPITVYVTGAVEEPESLIELPVGSRVQDAVEAVGGTLENADMERVNLADVLRDGSQVHVPLVGAVTSELEGGVVEPDEAVAEELNLATPMSPEAINVNTATLEELMTLPRIGEVSAERIIAYREENGSFANLDDLGNVSGIGPSTLEGLAELVAFE